MNRIVLVLAAIWLSIVPAWAGPLAAVIPIIVGKLVTSVVLKIVLSIVLSVAVSMLSKALQKKPLPPGIQTERKLTGGANSRTIMLGLYCTAGSDVCPPMSYGNANKTPNAFLTQVVAISDVPVDGLNRIILNGEYIPIGGTASERGYPLGGKYFNRAWIKFYDGRQTAADPFLLARYGFFVRPWSAQAIGTGVAYAIITYQFDSELYHGEPEIKFEIRGMRLYDPRKDSSVGGAGAHRWDNVNTWEITYNPMVMIYNILRGITFADGSKYGGECEASDLPLANWVAAMNVCDETVVTSVGNEPRYRAGFEINVADVQPADAIEELLKACSGDIVETGGIYKVRCGPPSLPIMFITDGDFLVNQPKDYDPFPNMNTAKNTIYATFPSPEENWATHDAPVQTVQAYVDRDQGIELTGGLQLPAVPYPYQVQRLMLAWLKDDQRWRQHTATLGHFGFIVEPLDTISWTSAHNQYVDKLFEVDSCTENLRTLSNTIALREVDPDDYNYHVSDELPDPVTPGVWELPDPQAVPGFGVQSASVKDANGVDRRPAILVYWDADSADDAQFIKLQMRIKTTTDLFLDTNAAIIEGSRLVVEGILPNTTYEVRGKFIAPNRPTEWSSWLEVTTPDVKLGSADVDADETLREDLDAALVRIGQSEADIAALETTASELQSDMSAAQADLVAQGAEIAAQGDQIVALGGDVSTLQTTVASHTSQITTNATAISNLQGDYASLSSIVSTQGAAITTNATAISSLTGDMSTVKLSVSAGNVNLVKNSSFANALNNWATSTGGWSTYIDQYEGSYAANGSSAYVNIYTNFIPVQVGRNYIASANMYNGSTSGSFTMCIYWYDGAQTFISATPSAAKNLGVGWSTDLNGRIRSTGVAPANAVSARIVFEATNTNATTAIKEVKLEIGAVMSPYTQEADVSTQYQAISTINGQYASLSSTVSTQGTLITNNATAITTLQGQFATLDLTVTAGAVNMVRNSTFIKGLTDWSVGSGSWAKIGPNSQGSYAHTDGASNAWISSTRFPIAAGSPYTASANMYFASGSGSFGIYIYWYAADDNGLGATPAGYKTINTGWGVSNKDRVRVTGTAPAGAAYARVLFQAIGVSGVTSCATKEVKCELGSAMSPYTQEADVSTHYEAINTLDTQYASLSSTVSTQGVTISNNVTAISGLNGRMGTAETTITTQGGQISTNATAITNLSGTVSTLQTTVSSQGASITSNTNAISTINGNVTTLFARYAMKLDVNGYITGWELNNNGSSGNAAFHVDTFSIGKPGGGARTEFSGGNWRVYDGSNVLRTRMGVW